MTVRPSLSVEDGINMDFTRFDRHIIMSQLKRKKLNRGIRYTAEFKGEAIKQIAEHDYIATDVA